MQCVMRRCGDALYAKKLTGLSSGYNILPTVDIVLDVRTAVEGEEHVPMAYTENARNRRCCIHCSGVCECAGEDPHGSDPDRSRHNEPNYDELNCRGHY